MKKIFLLLCLPFYSYSQENLAEKSDRVYNVYRRDAKVIQEYNSEFIKKVTKADSIIIGDAITARITLPYKKKSCFGDVQLTALLTLEAKENRARVSFTNVRYTITKEGLCDMNGRLVDLLECPKCGMGSDLIRDYYVEYIKAVYLEYHSFLKTKSKDDNW